MCVDVSVVMVVHLGQYANKRRQAHEKVLELHVHLFK